MYARCYFDLTMTLETEKFQTLFDRIYGESDYYEDYHDDDKYVDDTLASKGIIIVYHNSHKKKIKLKLNPNCILDDEDPDDNDISKLLQKVEKHLARYFNSEYGLDDFTLNKMTLTRDIDVFERKKAADYMKVIQRLGRIKGFSPLNDKGLNNEISFRLKGNSNGIEFSIYNLEELMKIQMAESESKQKSLKSIADKAEGVLFVDLRFSVPAIHNFADELLTSDQIAACLKSNKKIFINTLGQIIPYGDFYKKAEAMEIIRKKVADKKLRYKMLRLLVLVPEKKSLLLAQKASNCRKIKEVMYEFYDIELSPVTLSKRHDVKYLENMYSFL